MTIDTALFGIIGVYFVMNNFSLSNTDHITLHPLNLFLLTQGPDIFIHPVFNDLSKMMNNVET